MPYNIFIRIQVFLHQSLTSKHKKVDVCVVGSVVNWEFWSMNVANCYLGRRFCLSQDYNRVIRRLLKFSLQQRFTLVQEVSCSNQEEPDLYGCHFDTYRVLSFGEILLLILRQKRFYDHSVETSFPAKNSS